MIKAAWAPVLYAGIGICAAGYTLQMIGQKYVPSERATILLSTESLFSLFSGMVLLNEALSLREYIGCALIFAAVILAETGTGDGEVIVKPTGQEKL
jgi:drug/metabolite transporter (DMT)-like permease